MAESDKYEVLEKIGKQVGCDVTVNMLTVVRGWVFRSHPKGAEEVRWLGKIAASMIFKFELDAHILSVADPLQKGDQLC